MSGAGAGRAALYLAGERALETGVSLVRGAWDGVWLGLLDARALEQVDERYYSGEAVYVTDEHNQRGLFDWEEQVVSDHLQPGCSVLVTGAGGGREVLALLERGFDAVGYEPHPGLTAAGATMLERLGHPGRLRVATSRGWPGGSADDRTWDVVLIGWGAYMLVPSRRARVELLRAAARATGGRGTVVVSCFSLPDDPAAVRQFRLARAVAAPLRRARRAEPPVLGDALVPNYAHFFSRRQLEGELRAAGLETTATGRSGDYRWATGRADPQR